MWSSFSPNGVFHYDPIHHELINFQNSWKFVRFYVHSWCFPADSVTTQIRQRYELPVDSARIVQIWQDSVTIYKIYWKILHGTSTNQLKICRMYYESRTGLYLEHSWDFVFVHVKKASYPYLRIRSKMNTHNWAVIVLAMHMEYHHQLLIDRRALFQRRRRRTHTWWVRPWSIKLSCTRFQ